MVKWFMMMAAASAFTLCGCATSKAESAAVPADKPAAHQCGKDGKGGMQCKKDGKDGHQCKHGDKKDGMQCKMNAEKAASTPAPAPAPAAK